MGTLKVSILEKDGEEFEFPLEMDLLQAIAYSGFSGFNEDRILVDEFFNVLCDQNGNVLLGV